MAPRSGVLRLLGRFAREDEGAVAIIAALVLPLMLGTVALVEASKAYGVKNELQVAADAAALAGIREIAEPQNVAPWAIEFADRNMPPERNGGSSVLAAQDIRTGLWDRQTRQIVDPQGKPANAVEVTTRREGDAAVPVFLSAFLTRAREAVSLDVRAKATAIATLDKCYLNGFVAEGIIHMNSSNSFVSDFCMYGRQGVRMNSANSFELGTEVSMVDLSTLQATLDHNPGLEDALVEKDIHADAALDTQTLLNDLFAGKGPRPDNITGPTVTVSELPSNPVPGTIYHVTGPVDIKLTGGLLENIGIISEYPIEVRSNSNLRNVILASRQAVNIASNVTIGDADFCETGGGASLIVAGGEVRGRRPAAETNSNIRFYGVQMVSDGTIDMNSNLEIIAASMQSTGDISFNSSFEVAGCPDETSPNMFGGGKMVYRLVD